MIWAKEETLPRSEIEAIQLAKLKAEGQIRRIGPDRGGSWEVLGK